MRILLTPNLGKTHAMKVTTDVIILLQTFGIQILMNEEHQTSFKNTGIEFGDFFKLLNSCDFVVSIGGDGTMIHYAKHAAIAKKPLVGVNVGRLGFIATVEFDELEKLSRLLSGDYIVDDRMLLEVAITDQTGTYDYIALNDVVVSKGALFNPIDLEVNCKGKIVGGFRSDGMIFSTPTGATAYALSAGGPIIQPSMDCIAVTPICPHSLFARTTIFDEDTTLEISVKYQVERDIESQKAWVSIDAQDDRMVGLGDTITIRKSKHKVRLINLSDKQFHEIINDKFIKQR